MSSPNAIADVPVTREDDHRPPLVTITCRHKATADTIRQEWPDAVVDGVDDARRAAVTVSGDCLDRWIAEMVSEAASDYRDEESRYGQASLTDFEKRCLDFTRSNVFHARSVKAIAEGNGVGDWLAHYDPELTVDEHRDLLESVAGRGVTMRELPHRQFQRGRVVA
ncbi:hypothetical protein [Haloferax volcanii]|uniref:hypothetical protein n=1 Tax=Haloferax volcanii TaxID=2246 RepID=UPI00249BC116|nr:hypothetical protein [Haloferax alexandrinus]WEL29813.1 hypothetical protein HBNXHx_1707 [Haloferax alexandrinus]